MNKHFPISPEFVFQIIALLVAAIVIHAIYAAVIRPKAAGIIEQQRLAIADNSDYVAEQSIYVMIKDYEQEACFILMLWALAILAYKSTAAARQHGLLQRDLVTIAEGMRVFPDDARELSRKVESLPAIEQEGLLPRALLAGLHRFGATRNVQDVASATQAVCHAEADRLESELSMIRYIAWAIPSIGFIGTVRGIGQALGLAHKATEGDISGVTLNLGVAFNSTLIALLISIVLMFLVHQLQLLQERYVLDAEQYCERNLIRHLDSRTVGQ